MSISSRLIWALSLCMVETFYKRSAQIYVFSEISKILDESHHMWVVHEDAVNEYLIL